MEQKHDIETYSKLAEGATFFLREAFRSLNEAMRREHASVLFSEKLETIQPTEEDRRIASGAVQADDVVSFLQREDHDVLTSTTIKAMTQAWHEALSETANGSHRFASKHVIASIEVIGHFNNLGFFVETLLNRHYLFLQHSGQLDQFSYAKMGSAKTMERLVYLYKSELANGSFHLDHIDHLFKLRNKSVHFTPNNAMALQPKMEELFRIWKQIDDVVGRFEANERFNEEPFSSQLQFFQDGFRARWS